MKYFGYGANKTPEMMAAITGKPAEQLIGTPFTLKGYALGIQNFDQIPNEVKPGSKLPISPREVIRKGWSNPEKFRTYVIIPAEGEEVKGMIWDLTERDRDHVRDWEMVGDWYAEKNMKVTDENGQVFELQTEILGDGQKFGSLVDERDYEPFLNDLSEFEKVAGEARRQYLERNGLVQEGAPKRENLPKS